MKLAADPEAEKWLEDLAGEPEDFDWDDGNRTKNEKHGVEAGDVEAILHQPILFAGRITEPAHDEPRWLLLGRDDTDRPLALIFTRRGDRLRAISCRPASRNERKLYDEALHEDAPGE